MHGLIHYQNIFFFVMEQEQINKQFYSIGEVAKLLGENASLVRFWVNETGLFKLQTNKKGNRIFGNADVEKLKKLHQLIKHKGFTVQGAKQALKAGKSPEPSEKELLVMKLHGIKERLETIRDSI
jgi:DNA-binding transcriptional MerR regulator